MVSIFVKEIIDLVLTVGHMHQEDIFVVVVVKTQPWGIYYLCHFTDEKTVIKAKSTILPPGIM